MDWLHLYLWSCAAWFAWAHGEPGDGRRAVLLWALAAPVTAPLCAVGALLPDNRPRI